MMNAMKIADNKDKDDDEDMKIVVDKEDHNDCL